MIGKSDEKYIWTRHAYDKMRYYRLSESRVKRIIRNPKRLEEGILEGAVACMQPAEGKHYSEVWVMYMAVDFRKPLLRHDSSVPAADSLRVGAISRLRAGPSKSRLPLSQKRLASHLQSSGLVKNKKIKIITAWRYPGKAPEHDPVPEKILREIKSLL